MKKLLTVVLPLIIIVILTLTACTPVAATYSITLDSNGGTLLSITKVKSGEALTEPTAPEKTGYTFAGWFSDEELTTEYDFATLVDKSFKLYAKWTPVTITVSFDLNYTDAVNPQSIEVTYPNLLAVPSIPTRPTFAFTGWKLNSNNFDFTAAISTDITLVANWTCDYTFTVSEEDEVTITGYTKSGTITELIMPDTLDGMDITEIANGVFTNKASLMDITLPESLVTLGNDVFSGCSALTDIDLPDTLTSIGARAFKNCSALTIATLGNSLLSIGVNAFENCISLVSVVTPESTLTIGNNAFLNCITLGTVIIGTSVTSIGSSAFYGCSSILYVNIPDSVITIGERAFARCLSLINLTMGNGTTTIGSYAFDSCNDLSELTLGSSLTAISEYAFLNCSSLNNVVIPDSVLTIGTYAFSGCSDLSDLTVGSGVSSISSMAFSGNTSLVDVVMCPLTAPTLGSNVFLNISPSHIILVNSNSIGYFTGGWEDYNVEIYYVVNFNIGYDGGVNPAVQNVAYMGKAVAPTTPVRVGYAFKGWFSDSNKTVLFDFNMEITSNRTLYGDWSELYDFSTTDNKVTILGYKDGVVNANLRLPTQLGGNPVVAIAEGAFADNTDITHIYLPDSVSIIGANAFNGCTNIISVILGTGLLTIGDNAFYNCTKITAIILPSSLTTIGLNSFYNCNKLTSIIIPSLVTKINEGAFMNCASLVTASLNNNITEIGDNAFRGCSALNEIAIPTALTTLGKNAFNNCTLLPNLTIPVGVTVINEGTFMNCSEMTLFTSSDNITEIGDNAFNGCNKLESITTLTKLTALGAYAFNSCDALLSFIVPATVTEIKLYTFYDCSSLTTLTINSNLSEIGPYAFYNTGISTISLGSNLSSIGNSAFMNSDLASITIPNNVNLTVIPANAFNSCTSLTSVTILSNITTISDSAFSGCILLNEIIIPSSLTTIGNHAFEDCIGLTTLTLGNAVTAINSYAFSGCTNLLSINIPNVLTTLGAYAFNGCSSLSSIILPNSLTVIEANTFSGCASLGSITLGRYITNIKTLAFNGCSSLTSIDIPATITTIGIDAFAGNSQMITVIIRAMTAPTVGSLLDPEVFDLNANHKIYTPYGSSGYIFTNNPLVWYYWNYYNVDIFYTLTINLNYYGMVNGISTETILKGDSMSERDNPTCEYGAFAAWSYEADNLSAVDFENDPVNSNITIYALWDFNDYSVNFYPNYDEQAPTDIDVTYSDYAVFADPTREHYDFNGWYTEPECINEFVISTTPVTEDINLYADWTLAFYDISFDLNGATGVLPDTQNVQYGSYGIMPLTEAPILEGFVFLGWGLVNQVFDFEETEIEADITLIPIWEIA